MTGRSYESALIYRCNFKKPVLTHLPPSFAYRTVWLLLNKLPFLEVFWGKLKKHCSSFCPLAKQFRVKMRCEIVLYKNSLKLLNVSVIHFKILRFAQPNDITRLINGVDLSQLVTSFIYFKMEVASHRLVLSLRWASTFSTPNSVSMSRLFHQLRGRHFLTVNFYIPAIHFLITNELLLFCPVIIKN